MWQIEQDSTKHFEESKSGKISGGSLSRLLEIPSTSERWGTWWDWTRERGRAVAIMSTSGTLAGDNIIQVFPRYLKVERSYENFS